MPVVPAPLPDPPPYRLLLLLLIVPSCIWMSISTSPTATVVLAPRVSRLPSARLVAPAASVPVVPV